MKISITDRLVHHTGNSYGNGEFNMAKSVWTDTTKLPEFGMLRGTAKTDVLIIGGGLCGILCAYFLKNAGVDYILVEGEAIASGTTKNTTAKITSQHGLIYDRLIKSKGKELAALYLEANQAAVERYREIAGKTVCGFEEKSAFVYSRQDREKIEAEVRAVNDLGFPAEFSVDLSLPFETVGAVRFPNQAQFHPLHFIAKIAKDLNIYEHTFVRKVEGHTAWAETAAPMEKADGTESAAQVENAAQPETTQITADKIIVTTHFPFLNKRGSYFLKLYQHRSYVIALEHAADVEGMYIDEAVGGFSFRNTGNLMLLGGGSHRAGHLGGNWQELRTFAAEHYPQSEERYCWATQDCMSLDGVPYIGHYSKNTPNLYVASGFNKWGMTSSMVAAMLLCDMVQERENAWSQVFSPSRSMMTRQLLINGLTAAGGLLTPSFKRCPHMGCALKWNALEHTWDCSCHGSRFEKDGTLVDNPAKRGANVE